MKKLSNISESIWGDLARRSGGTQFRAEDDINIMDPEDFCDYLNTVYIDKSDHKIVFDSFSKRIIIAIIKKYTSVSYSITYEYKSNIISMNGDIEELVPELCEKIKENYNVTKQKINQDYTKFIISPLDGSECTNRFYIDVINFIIDNCDKNKLQLLKKNLNESIWGDLARRAGGIQLRAEDDINNLGRDELYDLIFDLYKQVDEHLTPLKGQVNQSRTYFHIPIFKNEKVYPLDVVFVDNKISQIKLMTYKSCIENFKHPLSDKFSIIIRPDKSLDIRSKDGDVSNQVCMDLIKTIVENAPEPYLKKREN